MYVYHEENGTKFVDFVPTHEPCSIRNTLLHFGMARFLEKPSTKAVEQINQRIRKKLVNFFVLLYFFVVFHFCRFQIALRKDERQYQHGLPPDEVFTAKIHHVVSPYEIYLSDVSKS